MSAEGDGWVCPKPARYSRENNLRFRRLTLSTRGLNNSLSTLSHAIGMEIRSASAILSGEIDFNKEIDNEEAINKIRRLLIRPAIEPTLTSYWHNLIPNNVNNGTALSFLEKVSGDYIRNRTKRGWSPHSNGLIKFESTNSSSKWSKKLNSLSADLNFYSELPIYAYVQTILAHPFTDGNGRLARSILHASLGRVVGFQFPIIALAPAFYMKAEAMHVAFSKLCEFGDWSFCYDTIIDTLELAVSITKSVLDLSFRDLRD